VFTCEWNPWAKRTYVANFGLEEDRYAGDIVEVSTDAIPDHDVLLAGFPCQPFSIAGVSKKNALGRPHGFECTTQGTLFFDVARIISEKRPKAFLLENVKNLLSHDGGNTFRVIRETLEDELGYDVHYKVIDASRLVPQHRERILIAGFRDPVGFDFEQIALPSAGPRLGSILHPEDGSEPNEEPYTTGPRAKVHSKYGLTDNLWGYLQAYAEKHRKAGNGFGFGLVDASCVARTLSARYYKDGSEILVRRGKGKNPRRLTPRECARLMGFPDSFKIPVSDTQAYKQFGNSVVVPVIEAVAELMRPHIRALQQYEETGVLELPLFTLTA
jgi:DNA (cytosine-5)-methyltransferase 1